MDFGPALRCWWAPVEFARNVPLTGLVKGAPGVPTPVTAMRVSGRVTGAPVAINRGVAGLPVLDVFLICHKHHLHQASPEGLEPPTSPLGPGRAIRLRHGDIDDVGHLLAEIDRPLS